MSTTPAPAIAAAPPDPAAEARRRTWILVAVCTGLIAVVASVSGLNVAQGQLAADLGATQSQLLWVINGYTIALAALLLPVGAIGDRWGRKQVLVECERHFGSWLEANGYDRKKVWVLTALVYLNIDTGTETVLLRRTGETDSLLAGAMRKCAPRMAG